MLSRVVQCWTWLRGLLSRNARAAADEVPPAPVAAAFTVAAPAVAGFVHRIAAPPVDFHLAARIASVAHLNTRAGRSPATRPQRAPATKAIPKLQQAGRKRSPVPTQRPLPRAQSAAEPTGVVTMSRTAPRSRCVPLDIRIAEAA
jgi:hypothetical protein